MFFVKPASIKNKGFSFILIVNDLVKGESLDSIFNPEQEVKPCPLSSMSRINVINSRKFEILSDFTPDREEGDFYNIRFMEEPRKWN